MNRFRVSILVILTLMVVGVTLMVSPGPAQAAGACYSGSYISNKDGHNFVAFNTGRSNAGHPNWAITKKPWQVQVAESVSRKPMSIWGPADRIGEVRAGFPWVDRLPWYYFFTPWDGFTICKR